MVAAIGLLFLLATGVVVNEVLWPRLDHPAPADAIVVLSGDHGERLPLAKRYLSAGLAPVLVLAGAPDSAEDLALCQGGRPFEVVCLRPRPDSTRSEARSAAQLAASRHWHSIIVVTSNNHVSRARVLFHRCFPGTLKVSGAPLPFGGMAALRAEIHEGLGLLYAALWARGC